MRSIPLTGRPGARVFPFTGPSTAAGTRPARLSARGSPLEIPFFRDARFRSSGPDLMSFADAHADVTLLLRRVSEGDQEALDRLFTVAYAELRRLAAAHLRREEPGHTLQPTALVHEAFLRMVGGTPNAADRSHFASIAARVMRRVLVDHARRRRADKRGGEWFRTTLATGVGAVELDPDELIALDEALETLDERQRTVVELRFFGGLEEKDIGALLGVTERTVRRDWVKARAWLYATLYGDEGEPGTVRDPS